MPDFATVQAASRTTIGTQDFTVSGFGTPKGALFFVTSGVTNGAVANHALLGVGATDGTRQWAKNSMHQDGIVLGASNAERSADTVDCVLLRDQAGTAIIRAQFSAWITDGVRINFSVAPGTAYLMTTVLMGGTGVSNVYVSTLATPAVIDTATDVTAPGFEPSFVLAVGGYELWDNTNRGGSSVSMGFVSNVGANPHPQYTTFLHEDDAAATTAVQSIIGSTSVSRVLSGGRQVEIQDFDASGFSAFTRVQAAAETLGYMAVKLNGIAAKVMAIDSPIVTGAQITSGIGFTPQFGMLLMSAALAYDTYYSDTNSEVWGVSVITTPAQFSHAVTSDDAVTTTTNAESVVHSLPVHLQKDGATFQSATFTAFGRNTMTLNYATANGTVRKWAALFVSETGGIASLDKSLFPKPKLRVPMSTGR